MRKIFLLIISLLMLIAAQHSTAQSYTIALLTDDSLCGSGSFDPTVSVWGEFGSIPMAEAADYEAYIYWGDGTSDPLPITASWSPISGTHTYMSSGTYTIHAKLFHLGVEVASQTVEYITYCHAFFGSIYQRNDADCVRDPDELYLWRNIDFQVKAGGIPIDTFTAFGTFYYELETPTLGVEYSFEPIDLAANGFILACNATPHKFMIDTLAYPMEPMEFGLDCDASFTDFDLAITANAFLRVATGPSYFDWVATNTACNATIAEVTLHISPKYAYNTSDITPTSIVGNTITWSGIPVSAVSTVTNAVTLDPVGTLTLGDTAHFYITITPLSGDVDTTNNTLLLVDSIRSAFDPNEKHVLPTGHITAGDELTYTIHFENLGNDTAFNIYIIDELSDFLDPSTFEMVYASHPAYPMIFEKEGKHILKFDMPNIKLPHAEHPDVNKGYVVFKLTSKSSMVEGDTIMNTAAIYFDYNPAVITNTVYSGIPETEGIDNKLLANGVRIYPNPSNGQFIIENNQAKFNSLMMVNALGQQILMHPLQAGINQINVHGLPAGVYYMTLMGERVTNISSRIIIK